MRRVTNDIEQISIEDITNQIVLVKIDEKLYQVTHIRYKQKNIFMLTDTITLEHYRVHEQQTIQDYIRPMLQTNEVYIK